MNTYSVISAAQNRRKTSVSEHRDTLISSTKQDTEWFAAATQSLGLNRD